MEMVSKDSNPGLSADASKGGSLLVSRKQAKLCGEDIKML